MSDRRIAVAGSLHEALRRRHPELTTRQVSKGTLVSTSHLIEELCATTAGGNVLVSGFQHGRNWSVERDRYLAMSDQTEVIAVFAGEEPPPAWETDHIGVRLRADDALTQEWFVLALGPELAVTLCGVDERRQPEPQAFGRSLLEDSDRLFEVIWSLDPGIAADALEVVLEAIARSAPERVDAVRARVAGVRDLRPTPSVGTLAADRLVAGMLARIEETRRREKVADRRASAAKTAFVSRMGHELRNPLNAIMGYAQLLEMAAADGDDSAQRIRAAGEHLLGLVDEVLDISQIETGRLRVVAEDLRVADLAAHAVDLIRTAADERAVLIDLDAVLACPSVVRADAQLAIEVLLNLLSNAVKYTAPGTTVTLGVHAAETIALSVHDQGPGIRPDDQSRIFEPFERLPATAADADGTGLGLALATTMAAAMDGRLEVCSRFGEGATFTLHLPTSVG